MGLGGGWEPDTVVNADHIDQAAEFIDGAMELGINFFDHADIYARGRAEEAFGRVLVETPGLREQMVIQSKCGIRFADEPAGTPQRFDFSATHIIASVEGILRRLHTSYLDILLLHRPDPLMEPEEIARAFSELKKAGKVRYFGVSNQNRAQMEFLQNYLPEPLVANQLEMSLLHHGFAEAAISFNQHASGYPDGWEGTLEYCRLKGLNLQAWSPLAHGALVGRDPGRLDEKGQKLVELIRTMSLARDLPPEAIALAWLLRHPAKIIPVLGTSRPERLAACVRALEIELTRADWYLLFETARGARMP
jgi:predicted oxidoreductase